MAGTKSKSQTQVSERQVPADSVPTARRARMQRLGTYVLQGPAADSNRLQPVAEISQKAYEIMNEERKGAAVVVVNGPKIVEEPKVGVNANPEPAKPKTTPKPKATPKQKAPAKPKSKSEAKRLEEQKKAIAKDVEDGVTTAPQGEILPEAASDEQPADTNEEK